MSISTQGCIIDPSEKRWIEFTQSSSEANIFHHLSWSKLLSESYGYPSFIVVVEDSKGQISAGVPVMEIRRRLRGKNWKALPFTDHCAPLCRDEGSLEQLSSLLISLFEEEDVSRMELRADFSFNKSYYTTSNYVLHKLTLNPDVETVYKKIHRMHVRNTEVAKKKKVVVKMRSDLAALREFYRLHLQTRQRQGVPVQPWGFFASIQRNLIDKGLGFLFNAYSEDKCVSTALFLQSGNSLTYKYGASNSAGQKSRANNLLFWTAIRWGCENGYEIFDFGKTANSNQGLKKFKSRWGADEVALTYSHLPLSPQSDSNGIYMRVMNALIRNSPIWVCRIMGEVLYRHFG